MDSVAALKTLKQLIGQTPLIIDPERDGGRFQQALEVLSTEKLRSYYQALNGEDRRRFHYVANVCLGYESWSRLYQDLVVQETQTRLTDRLEEAYAQRAKELRQREESLAAERGTLEGDLMRQEADNQALHRENLRLERELTKLQQDNQSLLRQQQQLLKLVERYKRLIQELKRFLPPSAPASPLQTTSEPPERLP